MDDDELETGLLMALVVLFGFCAWFGYSVLGPWVDGVC